MSKLSTGSTARPLLLMVILSLVAGALAAQPDAIPIAELTPEQYETLPAEQLIEVDDTLIALGEVRAEAQRHAERLAALEAEVAGSATRSQQRLRAVEAELTAGAMERAHAARQDVDALMAHFAQLAVDNPELVRKARAVTAQRQAAYELWIRSGRAETPVESKKIGRELKKTRPKAGRSDG